MILLIKNFYCKDIRKELKSYHNKIRVSKICTDAGFVTTVEVGQYFMTKDTANFSQFHAVACREYTLPRDEDSSEPKGWIRGNTKIGPALEVATCCLHGKYGVEVRIKSVNRDTSHSWVSLPGPTGVPPMPRQDGIGSRAPTLVVALCWLRCAGCVVQVVVDMSCGRCSYTRSTSTIPRLVR